MGASRGSASSSVRLGGTTITGEPFSYYRRLARVRRFVFEHYGEPITLLDAAEVAGMERTAFSKFFHTKTGVCFRDWLAEVRVARAMELMASRNLSVLEVGRAVGFENVRTFERTFLKVSGRPPIDYKKSVRPL